MSLFSQSFIRGCLAYRKEDRMDVFTLARHEYLQPPVPKHGRASSQQQQQQQQSQQQNQQNSSNVSVGGSGGGGGGGGAGGGGSVQQTSFSVGMFGQLNQSSSS